MNDDAERVARTFDRFVTQAADRTLSLKRVKQKCSFPKNTWFDDECKSIKKRLNQIKSNTDNNRESEKNMQLQFKGNRESINNK